MLHFALALACSSLAVPDLDDFQSISSLVPGANHVAFGDINGDGFPDIVTASFSFNSVVWFAGGPDGPSNVARFAGPSPGLVGALAVGDVDGDGFDDIVVVQGVQDFNVNYLHNDGAGNFDVTLLNTTGIFLGSEIYIEDFDQDGDTDVVVMHTRDHRYISEGPFLFDNLGGGLLAPEVELLGLQGPYPEMLLFDVDGDGLRDVVLGVLSRFVDWYQNPGTTGTWVRNNIEDQNFFRGNNLRAADLDGDGDLDLAVATLNVGEFAFYENLGGGAFGPRVDLGTHTSNLAEFEFVDADSDGDLDLIATTEGPDSLRWIENQGGFQFIDQGPFLDPGGIDVAELDIADINGDGLPDLILVDGEESVGWVPGAPASAGGLAFESAAQVITIPVPDAVESAVLDVNLDGILDVVSVSSTMGVFVASGLGGELFAAPERSLISSQGPVPAASHVRAADLDGSGTEDLLLSTPSGEIWFVPTEAAGGFGTPLQIGAGAPPLAMAPEAVDLDGDGDLDVLLAGAFSPDLIVLEQLSPGVFAPERTVLSVAGRLLHWVVRDFDVDGVLDVITAQDQVASGLVMELYSGLGAGTVGAPVTAFTLPGVLEIEGLDAQDVNGDGAQDLIWIQHIDRSIQRALNVGGGTFLPPEEIGTYAEPADAAIGGPPGPSGEATLLIFHRRLNRSRGDLEWFAIDGTAAISLAQRRVRLDEVASLGLHDVDGDGDLDVLLAAPLGGHIGWFNNTAVDELGSRECSPGVPNSSGAAARLRVVGASTSAFDGLSLQAVSLPPSATTLFITSRDAGLVMAPGGSQGTLCLGGMIGRFTGPGQVAAASASGFTSLSVNLQLLPQPLGSVSAMSGETWRFQAWYRDLAIGSAASNFTDAVAIQIQ